MLFSDWKGSVRSVDLAGKRRFLVTDGDRYPIQLIGMWAVLPFLWWLLLVWVTHQTRRSFRPVWHLFGLAAIALTLGAMRFYLNPEPQQIDLAIQYPINGLLIGFCMLAMFWCVFLKIRWPTRVSIVLFAMASLLAVFSRQTSSYSATDLISPPVFFAAILFSAMLFATMRLMTLDLVHRNDVIRTETKSASNALRIRDFAIWAFGVNLILLFARKISFFQPWDSTAEKLTSAAAFVVTIRAIAWCILGTQRWWIRIPVSAGVIFATWRLLVQFANRDWFWPFDFQTPDLLFAIGFVGLVSLVSRMNRYRFGKVPRAQLGDADLS